MEDIIQAFLALQERSPRACLYQVVNQNSAYTNFTDGCKNCYLISNAFNNEDTYFGRNLSFNRDCIDCDYCHHCELCYDCVNSLHCYNGNLLQDCENCTDCTLGYDLKGCHDCFACVGLRQKEFHIFNRPYTKEVYVAECAKWRAAMKFEQGKSTTLQYFDTLKRQVPRKFANIRQSELVIGDYITNSKNLFYCFDADDSQDCSYCYEIKKSTDCYDVAVGEFMVGNYECQSAWKLQNSKFCNTCWESSDLEYCDQVFRSQYCFFCCYLNHKEFHILNKPYTKEEYFKTVAAYKYRLKTAGLYGRWQIPSPYPVKDTRAGAENNLTALF